MNNEKITRKSFLHKIGLGALAVSAGGILLPETVKAGVTDNLNNGALAKQVNTNTKAISTLNNNLTANDGTNNVPFYFDYQDGQYGYNTSSTRGADTFSPFKSGFNTILDDGPVFIFRLYIGECTWLKDGVLSIDSPAAVSDYFSYVTSQYGVNLRNNKTGTYRYYITDSGGSYVSNSSTLLANNYTEVTFTTTGNYIGGSLVSTTSCYIVQYVEK